jgi:curved DNA-binding protein CbpA
MLPDSMNRPDMNPWEVLGVSPDVSAETLRQAYLKKLRQYPPDRSPEEFERIRDAYSMARNPGLRMQAMLTAEDPGASLASLLDDLEFNRAFVGPTPWLAVMKGK